MALTQAVQPLDLDLAVLAPEPFGVGGSLSLFRGTARVLVLAFNTFSRMGGMDQVHRRQSAPVSLLPTRSVDGLSFAVSISLTKVVVWESVAWQWWWRGKVQRERQRSVHAPGPAAGRQCAQRGVRGMHHSVVAARQGEFFVAVIVAVPGHHPLVIGLQRHIATLTNSGTEVGVDLSVGIEGGVQGPVSITAGQRQIKLFPAVPVQVTTILAPGCTTTASAWSERELKSVVT